MTESTSSSEIKDLDIAVLKQVERDIEASKKKRHSAPIRSIHPAKRHSQPPEESERRYSNKRISVLSAFSVLSTASSTSSIHLEPHFDSPEIVRDVIIGLSDGLTVPFALAAGLASLNNSRLVVTAGFAEIIAGAISMGLGGYLAGKSEIEHYDNERKREETEVELVPYREEEEIFEVFEPYGVNRDECQPIIERLKTDHVKWVDFMMKFELGLEKPSARRTWISALTIGFSYLFGGTIPLLPYCFIAQATTALYVSVGVTLLALFIFGYVKGRVMGGNALKSAIEMTLVGGAAAGAAFGIAKAIPQDDHMGSGNNNHGGQRSGVPIGWVPNGGMQPGFDPNFGPPNGAFGW